MLTVFLLVALAGALRAQTPETPPAMPLSLKKAIEIAIAPDGNARVAIAQELVTQAEQRRLQSRAALLPNLDGTVTFTNQTRNLEAFGIRFPSVPGFSFPTLVGPFDVFDARANLTQSILDMSSIRRYQASKVTIEAVKRDQEHTRNQVTELVARAYLAASRAQATVSTAASNVELSKAILKLANSQKIAGTGTGIEVTRAEVQLSNDNQRLLVARNEREKAHLQLLRAMGLKLGTTIELSDTLSYKAVAPIPMEEAVKQALGTRPDWNAQQQREKSARLSYSSVKLERLPSIGGFADYGGIGSDPAGAVATRTVGLSLRIPVWDGGRRDARRAESFSQVRQEALRSRDLREQVELDVRVSLENLQSADAQVKTAEDGLLLAEKELEQAERRYKAGVANSLEVTDAQNRLVRARDNRIQALFNHNLSRVDLGAALGAIERYLP